MCNSPLAKFVASHTQLGKKNCGVEFNKSVTKCFELSISVITAIRLKSDKNVLKIFTKKLLANFISKVLAIIEVESRHFYQISISILKEILLCAIV